MKHATICFLLLFGLGAMEANAQFASAAEAEEDVSEVFNYLRYNDQLTSAGQIAYDQVPSLKSAGYDMVINLATVSESGNALEGYLVAEQGISYINIPVVWQAPTVDDVQLFFDVMQAARDRKVFVHCAANMRASAFVYLYRTLVLDVDESKARADMETIWDPAGSEAWNGLIEQATAHFKGQSR
jgi:protein tyrosine phosphatase (PTP) superfamily phosphohydrolase (DUF442 family)